MTFGRIILMGLSYKYPRICRSYIYYQAIYLSLEWCLPRDYGDMEFNVLSSDNVMNFALLYYDFWPSIVAFAAPSVFQSMMSVKHYGTPADATLYMSSILGAVWQVLNFFMLHFVITSVGLLFVWAELMRGGNEQILNNLKESVVLVEQKTGTIMFANTAARRLNQFLAEEFNISLYDVEGEDTSMFN